MVEFHVKDLLLTLLVENDDVAAGEINCVRSAQSRHYDALLVIAPVCALRVGDSGIECRIREVASGM